MPGTEELKSLETWGHRHPNILNMGRCSHFVPSTIPEDEVDDYKGKLEEKDPIIDRYRALNEDAPQKGEEAPPTWIVKLCGDAQNFNPLKEGENGKSYAVNVLRSFLWPGSVTCS